MNILTVYYFFQMLQSAELSSGVCQDPWIWACGGWQDNNIAKTIWSYKDELDYKGNTLITLYYK